MMVTGAGSKPDIQTMNEQDCQKVSGQEGFFSTLWTDYVGFFLTLPVQTTIFRKVEANLSLPEECLFADYTRWRQNTDDARP